MFSPSTDNFVIFLKLANGFKSIIRVFPKLSSSSLAKCKMLSMFYIGPWLRDNY